MISYPICIELFNYQGYSALWQMTSNPGLFKCAVVICPISSVGAADEDSRNAFGGSPLIAKYWHGVFGKDVSTMRDVAIEASPMYHIHRVARGSKIALYHGENDRRAPIQHSYNMMRELQKWGIAGEFVSFRGEGHGLSKVANSLYVYHRIQTFLCKEFSMNTFVTVDDEKLFEQNTGRVEWS
jgi:dipeptidyl aminopeptidase/acylaminoacyl peptidase